MLPERALTVGDLVTLRIGEWTGLVGIVSQPVTEDHPGHVLVHRNGYILGVPVFRQDVTIADKGTEGFAQLAYNLIQLGSHVIEARLIV